MAPRPLASCAMILASLLCHGALFGGCGAEPPSPASDVSQTAADSAGSADIDAAAGADIDVAADTGSIPADSGPTPLDAGHDAAAGVASDGAADTSTCGACDDGNPCTADSCLAGACHAAPLTDSPAAPHPCDDGKPCTGADRCLQGACVGSPTRWQATFGGGDDDAAHDATVLGDGGVLVVGHTRSKGGGGRDAWLLRVDAYGKLTYDVALGDDLDQTAYGVHRAGDVGLVVGAWRHHGDPRPRGYYRAIDVGSGATVGGHVFALADASELHAVRAGAGQTGGVRVIAAGYVEQDDGTLRLAAARIDPLTHAPLWVQHHGDTGFDVAWDAAVAPDGGFALLGDTAPGGGGPHLWLVRLDDQGKITWQRTYFQDGEDSGWGLALHTDPALQVTGYVVAGRRKPAGAAVAAGWLMRADASGNVVWQQTLPAPGGAVAYDVAVVAGGHVAVGASAGAQAKPQGTLWRGDGAGATLWTVAAPGADGEGQAALVFVDGVGLAGRVGSGKAADVLVVRAGPGGELGCP